MGSGWGMIGADGLGDTTNECSYPTDLGVVWIELPCSVDAGGRLPHIWCRNHVDGCWLWHWDDGVR